MLRKVVPALTAWVVAAAAVNAGAAVCCIVHVPSDTPADASVYLAGSLDAVGSWKADGVKLARQPDGTFAGELDLSPGDTLEFKFTRGSWDTVEKSADGGERANRSVALDANTKTIDATVDRWASGPATVPAWSVVGTLELQSIDSKHLNAKRTIRVWLPPGYGDDAAARYDVLYLHDGQNCFDRATSAFGHEWEIDETLTKLIADKKVRPIIVVGIDNGGAERINEMTYAADPQTIGGHGGGHATSYAKFVIDEVLPFVSHHYRVNEGPAHTMLGGSSLGGLVSLDIVRRNPNIFGGVMAMSPSLWWRGDPITPAVDHDAGGLRGTRVWLDIGTNEEPDEKGVRDVDNAMEMNAALTKQGVTHRFFIDEGAQHNEQAWAKRFPEAIEYLLEK